MFRPAKQTAIITSVDDCLEFDKRKRSPYKTLNPARALPVYRPLKHHALPGDRRRQDARPNSVKPASLRAGTPQMAGLYDFDLKFAR